MMMPNSRLLIGGTIIDLQAESTKW